MTKVFISHAESDSPFADLLKARLEQMIGSEIEIVGSDPIAIGESMFDAIAKTVRGCDAMVYISSKAATDSQYAQAELAWGLAHGQTNRDFQIIPILRDEPHTVPHLIRSFLYLDLRNDDDIDRGIRIIAHRLSEAKDLQRSYLGEERNRAESAFIELQEALLQERVELLHWREKERQRNLRKFLLMAAVGSAATAAAVVYGLLYLEGAGRLLLIGNAFTLLVATVVAVAGYNSGAETYFRRRAAAIDSLLGRGPLLSEREDRP